MTEAELNERGYYLFGINQDEFVQVRDLETDKVLVMGRGVNDALARAATGAEVRVLLGCYTFSRDARYDAVAIDVGLPFIEKLDVRRTTYDQAKKQDTELYTHEFFCSHVTLVEPDDGELDDPGKPVLLVDVLNELGNPVFVLTRPTLPFLTVAEDCFFVTFDADDAWGNDAHYESYPFTAAELRKVIDAQPLPERP